jgi:hypothetical protein
MEAHLEDGTVSRFAPEKIRTCCLQTMDLELALTILGAKPLLTDVEDARIIRYDFARFRDAGLDVYRSKDHMMRYIEHDTGQVLLEYPTVWVYDPALIAPMLSKLLNTAVTPEKVRKTLRRFEDEAARSHELLGYADKAPHRNGKMVMARASKNILFEVANEGHNGLPYCADAMGSRVFSVDRAYEKLEGWALAAAIVEEIRESPVSVVSHAGINEAPKKTSSKGVYLSEDVASMKIAAEALVSRQKGDWLVLRYNTSSKEFGRKSRYAGDNKPVFRS